MRQMSANAAQAPMIMAFLFVLSGGFGVGFWCSKGRNDTCKASREMQQMKGEHNLSNVLIDKACLDSMMIASQSYQNNGLVIRQL